MAQYAFQDKDRKKIVYANDFQQKNDDVFYCENKECKAEMILIYKEGMETSYFRAKKNTQDKHCLLHSGNFSNFQLNKFDEHVFNFDDVITALQSSSPQKMNEQTNRKADTSGIADTNKLRPLRTITQIYNMCKTKKPSDIYNGKKIIEMLLDNRTSYFYARGIYGFKIVEALPSKIFFNNEDLTIFLEAPIIEPKYKLLLKFTEKKHFHEVVDSIIVNKEKILFIIAGSWKKSKKGQDYFETLISSKKQLKIITHSKDKKTKV